MHCTQCGAPVSGPFCTVCGTPVSGQATPALQPPPPPPYQAPGYGAAVPGPQATWANRAIAYLIDSVFVAAVMFLFWFAGFVVFGSVTGLGSAAHSRGLSDLGGLGCCCMLSLFPAAMLAVGLYNRVYLVSERGYSVGQGVMKIKIVDAQGNLLTFGTALIRLLVQVALGFIPILPLLDLLWPLWDPQRQTLHDKAVGSFAIDTSGSM